MELDKRSSKCKKLYSAEYFSACELADFLSWKN